MIAPLHGYPDLPLESARTQQDRDGALATWSVTEQATFVTLSSGKMTSERAKLIETATVAMARSVERYTAFHDWEALDDYDIEARLRLIALGVRFRQVGEVHLLVRSRMILAAVQTAQAVIKTLRIHEGRGAFEFALSTNLRAGRGATSNKRGAA